MISQTELDAILAQQPESVRQLCRQVVRLLANVAGLTGSVKFGWRSVNFRHEVAGLVCAVFPHDDRVAIYFENGRQLEDRGGLLEGSHLKKGRFLRLYPGEPVPETAIVMLVAEAVALKL
jgi:hypothetical protein